MLRRVAACCSGTLVAYPLVVALLVGLVAGYASAKPRVALVDEDGLPHSITLGGQRVRRGRDDRARQPRGQARPALPRRGGAPAPTGEVVATITVRTGFLARPARHGQEPRSSSSRRAAGRIALARDAAGAGARLPAQPPAPGGVHPDEPRLRGRCSSTARPARSSAATSTSSGSTARPSCSRSCRRARSATGCCDFVHDARLALGQTGAAMRATANPDRAPAGLRAAGAPGRSRRRCRPTRSP